MDQIIIYLFFKKNTRNISTDKTANFKFLLLDFIFSHNIERALIEYFTHKTVSFHWLCEILIDNSRNKEAVKSRCYFFHEQSTRYMEYVFLWATLFTCFVKPSFIIISTFILVFRSFELCSKHTIVINLNPCSLGLLVSLVKHAVNLARRFFCCCCCFRFRSSLHFRCLTLSFVNSIHFAGLDCMLNV